VANNPAKYPAARSLFEGKEKFNLVMDLYQKNASQKDFLEVTDTFCNHSKLLAEKPISSATDANKILENMEKACSKVFDSILKH
jgi:hypothetical protein